MFLHLSWGNLGHIILWLWKSWKTSSLSERCVSSLYSHVHVSPSACACDSKSSTRQTYLWNTPWKTLWRFCFTSFVLHQWREIKPMNQKMLLQMSVVGKKKKKKRKKKKSCEWKSSCESVRLDPVRTTLIPWRVFTESGNGSFQTHMRSLPCVEKQAYRREQQRGALPLGLQPS